MLSSITTGEQFITELGLKGTKGNFEIDETVILPDSLTKNEFTEKKLLRRNKTS